jgi:hypothetical protein
VSRFPLRDDSGAVMERIRAQLELYGLLVVQEEPTAYVRLKVVGTDGQATLEFDRKLQRERLAWLGHVLARMPEGEAVQVDTLASPGAHCATCRIRHVCNNYHEWAPRAWTQLESAVTLPLDTWGHVRRARETARERLDIELEDTAGRRVKVFRVGSARFDGRAPEEGSKLWFFTLQPVSLGGRGRGRHPSNFYEYPSESSGQRAVDLTVFGDLS